MVYFIRGLLRERKFISAPIKIICPNNKIILYFIYVEKIEQEFSVRFTIWFRGHCVNEKYILAAVASSIIFIIWAPDP